VPINTNDDQLKSFQGTLDLIKQKELIAIIGDDEDQSTDTIALTSAANNIIHCASTVADPALSDKNSYPFTFR
jgi:hypothetical protein